MDKLAQVDHSYCPLPEEYDRYRKNWYITLNKSGRNGPKKLRSDFREALTNMHRESGEERPEPLPLYQYQRWHSSSSSSSTSWWQWNENWLGSHFFFVGVRSFTADSNLLQPTGGVNSTPHTSPFLVFARMFNSVARDMAQGSRCSASCHPCFMWLCVLIPLRLSTLHSSQSLSSSTSSS